MTQSPIRSLIFGGLIPVIAFTVVEERWGTLWGLVLGMAIGVIEIVFEWVTQRRVSGITWIGNGMLLGLGGISLLTNEGIWFKLQPAIIEAAVAMGLLISWFIGRPLMVVLAKKQGALDQLNPKIAGIMEQNFSALTLRIGIFFAVNAAVATHAAFFWSTRAWAFLKGIGFTVALLIYMGGEIWLLRRRLPKQASASGKD